MLWGLIQTRGWEFCEVHEHFSIQEKKNSIVDGGRGGWQFFFLKFFSAKYSVQDCLMSFFIKRCWKFQKSPKKFSSSCPGLHRIHQNIIYKYCGAQDIKIMPHYKPIVVLHAYIVKTQVSCHHQKKNNTILSTQESKSPIKGERRSPMTRKNHNAKMNYLITLSIVDATNFPDRETFAEFVLCHFRHPEEETDIISKWAVSAKPHLKTRGFHYHMALSLALGLEQDQCENGIRGCLVWFSGTRQWIIDCLSTVDGVNCQNNKYRNISLFRYFHSWHRQLS